MKYPDNIKQAVILAGGMGSRLYPLTDKIPKPMAPVNGVPFLDYLIQSLIDSGIKKVLLLLGYKSEVIFNYYSYYSNKDLEIKFSFGDVDDQTGKRVLSAYNDLDDYFMLLYGDNYWPVELNKMFDLYKTTGTKIMTTVFSNKYGTAKYGFQNNIFVGSDNVVVCYDKTRAAKNLNGVDMGYFLVDKSVLDLNMIVKNPSFEEDILPAFVSMKQLSAYVTDNQYYFITDIENLNKFESTAIKYRLKFLKNTM